MNSNSTNQQYTPTGGSSGEFVGFAAVEPSLPLSLCIRVVGWSGGLLVAVGDLWRHIHNGLKLWKPMGLLE